MSRTRVWKLGLVAVALATGCHGGDDIVDVGGGGMALRSVVEGDVDRFRLTVVEVFCGAGNTPEGYEPPADLDQDGNPDGGPILLEEVQLEDFDLPAAFEDRPFIDGSHHRFADRFITLPPGCYDVEATPLLEGNGSDSANCSVANARDVTVYQETTTEVVLVSQCQTVQNGALDTVITLNREPTIEVELDKFAENCEQTQICATATDPDGDPLSFEWSIPDGLTAWFDKANVGPVLGQNVPGENGVFIDVQDTVVQDGNGWKSCILVAGEDEDVYQITVRAYDYRWTDGIEGNQDDPPLIRYFSADENPENWVGDDSVVLPVKPERLQDYCLRQQDPEDNNQNNIQDLGDLPECESHAELTFPYYVSDQGGPACGFDGGHSGAPLLVSYSDDLAAKSRIGLQALQVARDELMQARVFVAQQDQLLALERIDFAQQLMQVFDANNIYDLNAAPANLSIRSAEDNINVANWLDADVNLDSAITSLEKLPPNIQALQLFEVVCDGC